MSDTNIPGETRAGVFGSYVDIKHGDDTHHHYHASLAIDRRIGSVLRLGFLPPLEPGENPVMPMTAENLREFAAGALRMAEAIEAAEAARDARN